MVKKPTIPCDRCGARIDLPDSAIPEKCPQCGEIIRDRLTPFVRERVEEILANPPYGKVHAFVFMIAGIMLCALFVLVKFSYLIPPDSKTKIIAYLLFVPILFTFPAAQICLKGNNYKSKKPAGILESQYILLAEYIMTILVVFFTNETPILQIILLTLFGTCFIFYILGLVLAFRKPRNPGWLALMIIEGIYVIVFIVFFAYLTVKQIS